jgi:hypothetical protein
LLKEHVALIGSGTDSNPSIGRISWSMSFLVRCPTSSLADAEFQTQEELLAYAGQASPCVR